jgi:hypothetical protein
MFGWKSCCKLRIDPTFPNTREMWATRPRSLGESIARLLTGPSVIAQSFWRTGLRQQVAISWPALALRQPGLQSGSEAREECFHDLQSSRQQSVQVVTLRDSGTRHRSRGQDISVQRCNL